MESIDVIAPICICANNVLWSISDFTVNLSNCASANLIY